MMVMLPMRVTSEVVDAIVESGTLLIVDAYIHDINDSSAVTSSEPSESPCDDYVFMVIPTESSSSELSKFFAMIQRVVSSASSFIGFLEFITDSSLPLVGFDVYHHRHPIYLIFSSLGVMPRMSITLHLTVAHDITRQLANCDEKYKFSVYPYSILQDSEVIVSL